MLVVILVPASNPWQLLCSSVSYLSGNVSLRMRIMDFLSYSNETLTCKCYLTFFTENMARIFEEMHLKLLFLIKLKQTLKNVIHK